jgi:hypothetical protein
MYLQSLKVIDQNTRIIQTTYKIDEKLTAD